jgi:predicted metal-dependent enzyme (double-stranded beta helix superfamily)
MAEVLNRSQLRALVVEIAGDEELWRPVVRHDRDRRVFAPLLEEPSLEAWVISWMPGHDTGFHDHDVSSGAVVVIAGEVREERLALGGVIDRVVGPGEVFDFSDSDIHRVTHVGEVPAVTLHAYSPRLRRMGAYATGPGGALQRHPLAYGQELRPLASSQ